MARIRSLKPEIWMSPQVMNLSHGARLLFIGLITQADDEGRGSADVRKLKASIFGGDDVTSVDVQGWLSECSVNGLAILYHAENHGDLYALPSWGSHQSINRATKSRYPSPQNPAPVTDDSVSTHGGLTGDRKGSEGIGREGIGTHRRAREETHAHDPDPAPLPSPAAAVCVAMRAEGLISANPSHPTLLALIAQSADVGEFQQAAREAVAKGKRFDYALAIVRNRREEAQRVASSGALASSLAPPGARWEPPEDEPEVTHATA